MGVYSLKQEHTQQATYQHKEKTNGVTRALDNAQIASGAEDIIGSQNEGTLFIDLEIPYDTTSSDYFSVFNI